MYNNIPHGLAVSYLLPKVVRINIKKGCNLYADLYELIEGAKKNDDPKIKTKLFCSMLEEYPAISHLGRKPSDYGVNEDNYEFLAERGMDLISALSNNPVKFDLGDAKKVLKALTK